MISSVSWVPRGIPKEHPTQHKIDPDNLKATAELAEELSTINPTVTTSALEQKSKSISKSKNKTDQFMDELDMDNYDNEPNSALEEFVAVNAVFKDNSDDPYLTKLSDDEDSDMDESDVVHSYENMIVVARPSEDVSVCEIYLYGSKDGALFPHHEITLDAFPLSLSWMNFHPDIRDYSSGNCLAVGTMAPVIEIWDLDVQDPITPLRSLGKVTDQKSLSNLERHNAAVLGVSWHQKLQHLLASGSEDKTVRIWDINRGESIYCFRNHTKSVQTVSWNPSEQNILLSGGFDKNVFINDIRLSPLKGKTVASISIPDEIESFSWNPSAPSCFVVGCEDGSVTCFDIRHALSGKKTKPLFHLQAHVKATSCLAFAPKVPHLLATGSIDETIKLWDCRTGAPKHLLTKSMESGSIFDLSWSPDDAFTLGCGGTNGLLTIWDTLESAPIAAFRKNLKTASKLPPALSINSTQTFDSIRDFYVPKNALSAAQDQFDAELDALDTMHQQSKNSRKKAKKKAQKKKKKGPKGAK